MNAGFSIAFIVLGLLALVSGLLTFWHWLAAGRFPLHRRREPRGPFPGVTLLKPIRGIEPDTVDCLRSWLQQDYPGPVQVLFAVDAADLTLAELLEKLIGEDAPGRARIVHCERTAWPHPKVAKLIQAMAQAAHEIVVISDADVWAPTDLLIQAVTELNEPSVGLVNCFYSMPQPQTLAVRWAASGVNADFWGQVLQSHALKPQDFALGAVMMTTRENLAAIGSFEAFADFLADDYQLGHRITALGKRVALTGVVVECRTPPAGWAQVWRHQLRQARNIRVCQPVPYFFSILNNGTLWPLLWMLASPGAVTGLGAGALLFFRIVAAIHNEQRLTRSWRHAAFAWFIPIKDVLHAAVWAMAFLGNDIEWRGRKYRLLAGGRLAEVDCGALAERRTCRGTALRQGKRR